MALQGYAKQAADSAGIESKGGVWPMWRETDYGGDGAAGQKKHGLVGLILHSHLASGSKNCGHSGPSAPLCRSVSKLSLHHLRRFPLHF